MSWLWLIAQAAAGAWVLEGDSDHQLKRALRITERAEPDIIEVLAARSVCVQPTAPSDRILRRLTRILGHPPEERLDCDVAWFPLGRGWIAVLVEPPADRLGVLLDRIELPYVDVRRPVQGPGLDPIRICVIRTALREPLELARALHEGGLVVRSTYEVGGCTR
ncbi:MAG TPA: hypothetical protein ENK18_18645 [Deltaproteobacteria bacterium]|nr:hypothetical protein [Deltaproteobacteria bacterium]